MKLDRLNKKPKRVIIGEGVDYYKLFYALKSRYKSSFLFESLAQPKYQDRYYALGFEPLLEFRAKGDTLTILGDRSDIQEIFGVANDKIVIQDANPYDYLKHYLPMKYQSEFHEGGLVGYFAYESVNYFEPSIRLPEHTEFETFHLGLYVDGLIYDSTTDLLTYYTFDKDRSARVKELVARLDAYEIPTVSESVRTHDFSSNKKDHTRAVEHMLDNIRAGNSFQGEVGYKADYTIVGDKIAIYDKLRQINPSPYMFYVVFDDIEIMGSSPEILVKNSNRSVLTTPTAGTIHRDSEQTRDKQLARQLLDNPKEVAEHAMLIDLHRNDIARVCIPGTVKVANLMYIAKFSHVQHITSDIVGTLSKDKDGYDLLASILPGGVVAGAPKIETIKIIHESEGLPRGPYGGAVGRFSMNGDMVFCLPIRSLFCKGDHCFTQTSSGIVYDSDPDKEYEEIAHKHAAMKMAIEAMKGDAS